MSGRHRTVEYRWHTAGFISSPPGWRTVFLGDDGEVINRDLPGWLVQEEVVYDRWGEPEERRDWPPRRVVAATIDELAELHPAYDAPNFWYVASPNDVPPTAEEIEVELAGRPCRAATTGDEQ